MSDMLKKAVELRQECAAKVEEAGKILSEAHAESRAATSEEMEKVHALHADADKSFAQAEAIEKQVKHERDLSQVVTIGNGNEKATITEGERRASKDKILRNVLLKPGQRLPMSDVDKRVAAEHGIDFAGGEIRLGLLPVGARSIAEIEKRAGEMGANVPDSGATFDNLGKELVAEEWMRSYEAAILTHNPMRQSVRVLRTATGAKMHIPCVSDGELGEVLGEHAATSEQSPATGEVVSECYKVSSKVVKVSVELLQDSVTPIGTMMGEVLGKRIGRRVNLDCTVGDGSATMQGITLCPLGFTSLAAGAVDFIDMLNLKHSLHTSWRANGSWMLPDSLLLTLKTTVDTDGKPIFQPDWSGTAPGLIDGDPYTINDDMADVAAGSKSVVYGDMNQYVIRDAAIFDLMVLRERYAETHSVAYLGFGRHDGRILDAHSATGGDGTDAPIKHLLTLT